MSVYLIHAKTEPHVWILLEVIAVIALLDTLEATVKQVLWIELPCSHKFNKYSLHTVRS